MVANEGRNNGAISPSLYEEILLKVKKIGNNPEFYDQRGTLVKEGLRSLGDIYSYWIENPELRKSHLLQDCSPGTVKKKAMKGIRHINNAWYFLSQTGQFGNFVELLNKNVLKGTNGLINGGIKESGEYRQRNVTLNFRGFTPVGWEKVPGEIENVLASTKSLYRAGNRLESAIYSHLALALTQPFNDGNKRTSRLIQDRILYDAGLPSAIIPAGEAKFYLSLLEKSAWPFRDGNKEGQRQFYDYMASKVNNGLDEILNDLGQGLA